MTTKTSVDPYSLSVFSRTFLRIFCLSPVEALVTHIAKLYTVVYLLFLRRTIFRGHTLVTWRTSRTWLCTSLLFIYTHTLNTHCFPLNSSRIVPSRKQWSDPMGFVYFRSLEKHFHGYSFSGNFVQCFIISITRGLVRCIAKFKWYQESAAVALIRWAPWLKVSCFCHPPWWCDCFACCHFYYVPIW